MRPDVPRKNERHQGWTWVTIVIVVALAVGAPLLLCTCIGGYVYLAFTAVQDAATPRVLPNHHTLETVNGDWHGICRQGGSLVDLSGALPGAFEVVIDDLAVSGPYVFGTVRDGGPNAPPGTGYFLYDTRNGATLTFTTQPPWSAALTGVGLNPSTPLGDPLLLPKVK